MADNSQHNPDEIIVIGDRVDLVVEAGQVYRALIEDRIDDGPFLVAIPTLRGVPMQVEQDDDIYLVFYRESGRYIAQMKVIGIERRMDTRYMWLLQKTWAQKNQRREAYRLPVGFSVQVYEYDEDMDKGTSGEAEDSARAMALEKADSRDLSITGIALITRKQYVLDDMYILVMRLESSTANARNMSSLDRSPPLQLTATVKRSIPWRGSGKYNTGMQFFGMTRRTSEEISRFVLAEQQKLIRINRLRHT